MLLQKSWLKWNKRGVIRNWNGVSKRIKCCTIWNYVGRDSEKTTLLFRGLPYQEVAEVSNWNPVNSFAQRSILWRWGNRLMPQQLAAFMALSMYVGYCFTHQNVYRIYPNISWEYFHTWLSEKRGVTNIIMHEVQDIPYRCFSKKWNILRGSRGVWSCYITVNIVYSMNIFIGYLTFKHFIENSPQFSSTVMHHITFRSMTDCIYDGGPII